VIADCLAVDDLDGELSTEWEVPKAQGSSCSLSKGPGTLTITAKEGGFARTSTNYKNVFLIDSRAGQFVTNHFQVPRGGEDIWLRLIKQGCLYTVASSFDGKSFIRRGTFEWSAHRIAEHVWRAWLFQEGGA
jgi:hypothetical protein